MAMNHLNTKEEVVEAFRVFDKTGSGYITAQELQEILHELGDFMDDAEIQELIYEADMNRDGNINYTQFVDKLFMWN